MIQTLRPRGVASRENDPTQSRRQCKIRRLTSAPTLPPCQRRDEAAKGVWRISADYVPVR
jgi:hypothetical protein